MCEREKREEERGRERVCVTERREKKEERDREERREKKEEREENQLEVGQSGFACTGNAFVAFTFAAINAIMKWFWLRSE